MTTSVIIGIGDGSQQLSRAVINSSAGGDILPVAAVPSQIIRVYKMLFVVTSATTITFKDGAAGTAVSGPMDLAANGSVVLDMDGQPWYVTSAGNAFAINSSAAVKVAGTIWYTQTVNTQPA
jgi:hypothetical protein